MFMDITCRCTATRWQLLLPPSSGMQYKQWVRLVLSTALHNISIMIIIIITALQAVQPGCCNAHKPTS